MGKPLRVLIVEDSDDDAQLVLRELKKGGFEPTHQRVETAEAMSAALEKQAWEVIISDYVLPRFSGPDALKLLQGKGLDIPFIIVSGKITEEAAVEVMKAGAHDYLLKDRLARLCSSVEQELRNAATRLDKRRAEEAMRESEGKFRSIFDAATDGIILADMVTKKFADANRRQLDMLGHSLDEIRNMGVMDIHPQEKLPYVLDQFEKQSNGEITLAKDIPVKRKDGSVFYADISSGPIELAGKHYLMGIFHDITERRQAEEKQNKHVQELEIMSKAAIGRELKMIAQEKEVNSLLKELGRKPKYKEG
jgi:PAS domain S-box-containing protein